MARNTNHTLIRVHNAMEVVRKMARKRGLFVNHSFDINAEGKISFWVRIMNDQYDEVLDISVHDMINHLDKVTDAISKGTALAQYYNKEDKREDLEF